MKKYIFVCKHNFTRSKFGAEFFRGFLKGKGLHSEVISRGIGFSSYFIGKRLKKLDLTNVEKIFVMEKYMKDWIISKFSFDSDKIVILDIMDIYGFFRKKSIKELDQCFQMISWKKYL